MMNPDKVGKGMTGNKNFNIKDPDGHIVEIVEYQGDSWTAREAGKFKMAQGLEYKGSPTTFHGYEHLVHEGARVTAIYVDGTSVQQADSGDDAVVDEELRVRGIDGLRVADASIMPTLPRGNPNLACMMIGEKAADLVLGRILAAEFPLEAGTSDAPAR